MSSTRFETMRTVIRELPIPTARDNAAVMVERVDPHDQQWAEDNPIFRVYFWKQLGAGAFESDEFELSGADVNQALSWAEQQRDGRTFTLYLRRDDASGRGLVLLAGADPTSNPMTR